MKTQNFVKKEIVYNSVEIMEDLKQNSFAYFSEEDFSKKWRKLQQKVLSRVIQSVS